MLEIADYSTVAEAMEAVTKIVSTLMVIRTLPENDDDMRAMVKSLNTIVKALVETMEESIGKTS